MKFTGPSANYITQQVRLALGNLAALQKLDAASELQGLAFMQAVLQERAARLAEPKTEDAPNGTISASL